MNGGLEHSNSYPFILCSKLQLFLKQSTHLDSFSFKTHSDFYEQKSSAFETKAVATYGSS